MSKRYPEEFKGEAVKQVTDPGHSVAEVASRLGTTTHSLYAWIKKYGPEANDYQVKPDEQAEIRRLTKEHRPEGSMVEGEIVMTIQWLKASFSY